MVHAPLALSMDSHYTQPPTVFHKDAMVRGGTDERADQSGGGRGVSNPAAWASVLPEHLPQARVQSPVSIKVNGVRLREPGIPLALYGLCIGWLTAPKTTRETHRRTNLEDARGRTSKRAMVQTGCAASAHVAETQQWWYRATPSSWCPNSDSAPADNHVLWQPLMCDATTCSRCIAMTPKTVEPEPSRRRSAPTSSAPQHPCRASTFHNKMNIPT
jgi:hypothetical protein